MIAIIDYDSSITQDICTGFEMIGATAEVVASIERIDRASKIVLPPTTSFPAAIRSIRDKGLVPSLMQAIEQGRPILGIGHGMHLLFDVSYEQGQHTGLGVIPGKVTSFDFGDHPVGRKVTGPHRGLSPVSLSSRCPIFAGLKSGEEFYFDHAFFAEPLDARLISATCNYGVEFSAAVWNGPIFGVQFLPHRSDDPGRKLLKNFAAIR